MMLSEKPRSPVSEHRKVTKSAMEKKRRARINSSLTELKTILAGIMAYKDERFEKMEKADILEMTVNYVKELQNKSSGKEKHVHQGSDDYRTGVNSCISEVLRYVTASDICDTDTKTKLLDHLANRVNDISTTAKSAPAYSPIHRHSPKLKVIHDAGVRQADMNNNVSVIPGDNKTPCLNVNTQNVTLDTPVTQCLLGSPTSPHRSCSQSPTVAVNLQKQIPVSQTQPNFISMSGQTQVVNSVSQIQPQVLQNIPLTILVPANFCTTSTGTTCVIPLTLSNNGCESSNAINPINVAEDSVKSVSQGVDHCRIPHSDITLSPNGLSGVNDNSANQEEHLGFTGNNSHRQCQIAEPRKDSVSVNVNMDTVIHKTNETVQKCLNFKSDYKSTRNEIVSESLSTTQSHQITLSRKSPSSVNTDQSVWRPWRL